MMAFKLVFFCGLVAIASAASLGNSHDDGHHEEDHHAPALYEYSYSVHDPHTGDIKEQHEQREGDNVQGHYSLVEPDGHKRIVHYTADHHSGFNAVVQREGTAHQESHAQHVVPIAHHATPIISHHHAAPVISHHHVTPVIAHHSAPIAISHHSAPISIAQHSAPLAHSHSSISTHHVSHHAAPVAVSHHAAPIAIAHHVAPVAIAHHVAPVIAHHNDDHHGAVSHQSITHHGGYEHGYHH